MCRLYNTLCSALFLGDSTDKIITLEKCFDFFESRKIMKNELKKLKPKNGFQVFEINY